MNLRQKIRWTLLAVGVLPLALVSGLGSLRFFEASQTQATAHLTDLAASGARALNSTLTRAVRDTQALAHARQDRKNDGATLAAELARFNSSYPYFKELLWVQPSGVVLASSYRAHAGQPLAQVYDELEDDLRQVLQEPAGLIQLSDLDDMGAAARAGLQAGSLDDQQLTLQLLLRMDDAQGQVQGVLVSVVHIEALREALRDAEPRALGDLPVVLLNRAGRVLLTSQGTRQAGHAWIDELSDALALRTDSEYALVAQDAHGTDVVAVANLPGLAGASRAGDWRVMVAAPLELLTAPARRTLLQSALWTVGVAAVCVALSLWLARRYGRRIEALLGGVQAVGRGEFSQALPVESNDELGHLAQAFNRMAADTQMLMQDKDHALQAQRTLGAALSSRGVELERSLARLGRQNSEITQRNKLGELLQSAQSEKEALTSIAHMLPSLFPGASGTVYMSSPDGETLVAVARWGDTPGAQTLTVSECWALRRGRSCLETRPGLWCAHMAPTLAGTSVCVPLLAHTEALGLLHMVWGDAAPPEPATPQQRQVLAEAVAAQCSMALANLRLRESLHQQSVRDALTGLHNRRYLESTLPREVARAQRGARPLAVFMLDVDHFKIFNDNYGHDAGDLVLQALGQTLQSACRRADIACRFGGEEFTVVLPDADEYAAREWAERLLQQIRGMQVQAKGQPLPPITVSMGLALLPQHGNDGQTLLQAADLALYDAKHAGRDRLVVSANPVPPDHAYAQPTPGHENHPHC